MNSSEAEIFVGPVKMAKYVTPGDQRRADSILPFVEGSNTGAGLRRRGVLPVIGRCGRDARYDLIFVDRHGEIISVRRRRHQITLETRAAEVGVSNA